MLWINILRLALRRPAKSTRKLLRQVADPVRERFMISIGRIPADGSGFAQVSAIFNKIKHKC
jgi:hypothetical protein